MPYEELYQKLNYRFKNENLLIQALTRTSAFNLKPELRQNGDFQRLEFIGDKILGQIISDIFFDHYPDWSVGTLTTTVASHVNNQGPLADIAYYLGLDKLLIMDQGEELNLVRVNTKVLSDATEALIGAIWIDSDRNYNLLRKIIWQQWNLVNELPRLTLKEFDERYFLLPNKSYQNKICLLFEKQYDQALIDQLLLRHDYDEQNLEILKIILDKKPGQQSLNNALVNAILDNNLCVLQALLQSGADPNFIYSPEDNINWNYGGREIYDSYRDSSYSVLQIAIIEDSSPYILVKTLLEYGADPNWNQGWSKKYTLREMLQKTFDNAAQDIMATSGLDRFFPPKERTFSLKELASMSVQSHKPKEKFMNLNTALHFAVMYQDHKNRIEILLEMLLKAGANPNLLNHEQKTALDIVNGDSELSENTGLIILLSKTMNTDSKQSFNP